MSVPYLHPIDKPKGLLYRLLFPLTRRLMGKVPTPLAVFSARMPVSFLFFYGKISRMDRKLKLPPQTAMIVREQVARTNACMFCQDVNRWSALRQSPVSAERFDALPEYRTSPLFGDAERAALDYAGELAGDKAVRPETFQRLARYYSEREICDVVWLVASEHVYNLTNHGLNIGSDGYCELRPPVGATSATAEGRRR